MRVFNIVVIIVCGLVGLWGGYWLGHLAGWSENAVWPGQIGGGAGATVVSVILGITGVAVGTVTVSLPTYHASRRLLQEGIPVQATVLKTAKAGLTLRGRGRVWDKVCCQLEVHPEQGEPFRTKACQFMTTVEERALVPEAVVSIRYDPKKPGRAVVESAR